MAQPRVYRKGVCSVLATRQGGLNLRLGENHSKLYDRVLGSINLTGSTDPVRCRVRLGCYIND